MRHILLFVILAAVFYSDVYGIYPARVGKRSPPLIPPSDEDIDCSFGLCKFNGKLDGNVGNRGHGPGRLGLKNQNQYAHDPSLSPRQLSYEEFMAYPGQFNKNGHIKSPTSHFPHPTNGLGRRGGPKFAAAEGSQPRECQVGEPCFEDPYNPVHRRFNSRRFGSNNNDEDEFGPRSRLPEPFPYGLKRRNNNENRQPRNRPSPGAKRPRSEYVCKCDDPTYCWQEDIHLMGGGHRTEYPEIRANRSSWNIHRTRINTCAYDVEAAEHGGKMNAYERLVRATASGQEHYNALNEFAHEYLELSIELNAAIHNVTNNPGDVSNLYQRNKEFLRTRGHEFLETHGNDYGKNFASLVLSYFEDEL